MIDIHIAAIVLLAVLGISVVAGAVGYCAAGFVVWLTWGKPDRWFTNPWLVFWLVGLLAAWVLGHLGGIW
jgi:hypothetical protein